MLSVLPTWRATEASILTAPSMGARFAQYMLTISRDGGTKDQLPKGVEAFFYVISGGIELETSTGTIALEAGGFAFLPPGADFRVAGTSAAPARVAWLKKRYEHLGAEHPEAFSGHEKDIPGGIYMGLEGLLLKELVPAGLGYDMAMNIFTFQPGWSLPMVETHVMEHGLVFLQGQGLYYLGDKWMDAREGDFIWMGPYCPRSFYATGQVPSRYIYYKNVNRDVEL